MSNIQYKDGAGVTKYTSADGAGTDLDPQIPKSKILELPTATEGKLTAIRDRIGNTSTTVASDGDLQLIDTDAEAIALNPVANTAGASSVSYSQTFLWRWLIRLTQIIIGRLPALSGGRIPVDVSSLSVTVGNAQLEISNDSGNPIPVEASSLPLPAGASTNATLTEVRNRLPDTEFSKLQYADDLSQIFTYLGAGTADERIETITYSSTALSLSVTETYTYAGSSGSYRVSAIVRS